MFCQQKAGEGVTQGDSEETNLDGTDDEKEQNGVEIR